MSSLFGDDDSLDLSPPTSGSSLSALFASGSDNPGTSALSFQRTVAPSAKPKKEKPKPAPAPAPTPAAADGSPLTLFAALVQAFRNVSGAWQPVGPTGLALVGGPLPKAFLELGFWHLILMNQ